MKVTADTNLLVRMAVRDDDAQARAALKIFLDAEIVFLPLPCILELVWVLGSVYQFARDEIIEAVTVLIESTNVSSDVVAIQAGLRVLHAGGDFADGVIAKAGATMGADAFVSFDRRALKHVSALGLAVRHASTAS